jgi:dienelactone hydrolase
MLRLLASCAAALLCAACAQAPMEPKPRLGDADAGTVWFASAGSLAMSPDRLRMVPADPVTLSGELKFPAGAGPFPAVILAHGCGGTGAADATWAPVLREWGYATFVVDSFRGRGLTRICVQPRVLSPTQRIPDVYGALRILATHPRIDARRVALMGFSHGGDVALRAATQWAKDRFAPPGQPGFRALLPFYPFCGYVYPERQRISAPLRLHHGELDDWLPVAPCIRLVESLKVSRQDAGITVYPGGLHGFDNAGIGSAKVYLPDVGSLTGCTFAVGGLAGPYPKPRESDAQATRCLRKGASIGYSAEASAQARRVVRAQLAELLK